MYNDNFNLVCKNAPVATDIHRDYDTTNPHIHKEFEIIYVSSGKTCAKIGPHCFSASKGDIILANPMEVHSLYPDDKEYYEHYCICFDVELISDKKLAGKLLSGSCFTQHIFSNKKAAEVFQRLFEVCRKDEDTAHLEAGAYISMLFALLMKSGHINEMPKPNRDSAFYAKVMDFIAGNYDKNITSAHLAEELFYTQSHFCRAFAEKFGTSFSLFLNIYRISKAKEMLGCTSKSITNVALECGFSNINYFSRCFKRQVGMSPSEYKKYQYNTNNMQK